MLSQICGGILFHNGANLDVCEARLGSYFGTQITALFEDIT